MKKGFTLIELVVSLSIFMLITGLMLANFRAGDNSNELQKSAELLASRIREAQTRALSGVGGIGVNGHGVYLVDGDTTFVSYVDVGSAVNEYDASEATVTTGLLDHVQISGDVDILFAVPSGDVYVSAVLQTQAVTSTIMHTDTGLGMDIILSPTTGQVTISDPY